MPTLKGKGRQSTAIAREEEGADVFLRALRDGAMVSADWKQAAIIGGFGYQINEGALTTGQTGGGEGTILDADQPEVVIGIPNGYCILPLRIEVACKPGVFTATTDECDILIAVDQDLEYTGSGTCDTLSVYNMNTLCGKTSVCLAKGGCSAGITAPTHDIELARWTNDIDASGTEANFIWNQFDVLYEPKRLMVINGGASLYVYFGGTVATTGFVSVQWLEFPETAFAI